MSNSQQLYCKPPQFSLKCGTEKLMEGLRNGYYHTDMTFATLVKAYVVSFFLLVY